MPQKVKETKHTVQGNGLQTTARIMQVLFALVQILLVFRFSFKLLGANAANVFVNLIYATTAPLVGLFEGIFSEVVMEGSAIFTVLEPATVIAIIVTAAVSYIVLRMLSVKQGSVVEHVEVEEQTKAIPPEQVSKATLQEASQPAVEALNNGKLEKEAQELEEKILHQKRILEQQRKTYGASHIETETNEDQGPALDNPVKMYSMSYDKPNIDEPLEPFGDDVRIYERSQRPSRR